ncbi:MAG: DNA-directed polymerase subunit beta [Patescibacteria group bacterium]|jgi:DNA-directed RNA polymerase subunit beta|nr:DNA-directed polymerase subunit beta [Patescibacteria group bacterium]
MAKTKNKTLEKKYFSKYKEPLVPMPNLLETQIESYKWLIKEGIKETLKEFSPMKDYSEKKFELSFESFTLGEPKHTPLYTKENKLSYEAPLKVRVKLLNRLNGSTKEQEVFFSDFPLMTKQGTFIINGVERVIVPQLTRSSGVFFTELDVKGRKKFGAKIIPNRGVWIEFETDKDNTVYARIDKKRKFPVTELMRVMGLDTDDKIRKAFKGNEVHEKLLNQILDKDSAKTPEEAYVDIYKRLRDGDMATSDNAKEFIDAIFNKERYDFSAVGRHRFNSRFEKSMDKAELARLTLNADDIVTITKNVFDLNTTPGSKADDIDHLGRRRVRYVGELLQQKFRVGMTQIKRNIQDRMSTIDGDTATPVTIINQRPLQARIKEFFTTNQLSQFMDQENVLSELEHLRTLSALGPGGLTRERAGLEVRDVHTSHYGRVCPIHTPEGPNIGLVLHLSTYSKINEFGVIETPYVKVKNGKITGEVIYMNALEEEKYNIAHAGVKRDDKGNLLGDMIEARKKGSPGLAPKEDIDFIDVATNQAFSVGTSMIPFLEHNDANRALMGSNMQKQSVPCIVPQAAYVATGMEDFIARDSGRIILAEEAGTISYVDSKKVVVENSAGKKTEYDLIGAIRTNKFSMMRQRPVVSVGDKVKKGDVLADAPSTVNGQVALGQNVRVAFMSWNGRNYEDAIILSERLVKNSIFSSIYVEEFICVVRDTKLGPEVTTRDIPNVGESKLVNLDEEGIVRVGAEVRENDILVGKITPKGETELTPEERLLRSIFAEKARDVKDTSMRVGHGGAGRVISVKVFSRDKGHQLESGIIKKVVVEVAQLRNISVGDKLAGRHGNKGVISTILPEEEMPYTKDGEPVDVILTPLGVPSRMNLGQILEIHLGLAANALGYQAIVPLFGGATVDEIKGELRKAGLPEDGQVQLYDGRTGEPFDQKTAMGYMYMLKLHHMVEDKVHARAIGPYSLITQQPLGGKAQSGGQRFGEMEVWALEGYGAAHALREMLTIKSDDILGRSQTFDSIIKGEKIQEPNIPASFKVMLNYLRGLALDIDLTQDDN